MKRFDTIVRNIDEISTGIETLTVPALRKVQDHLEAERITLGLSLVKPDQEYDPLAHVKAMGASEQIDRTLAYIHRIITDKEAPPEGEKEEDDE